MTSPASPLLSADEFAFPHRFAGQRAVVTGAASGIGRAVARRLATEGATVLGLDTDEEGLEDTFDSLAGASSQVADVRSEEAAAAVEGADVLVNAAGILERHDFLTHPLAAWGRTLAVNLIAPQRLSRAFARARIESGAGADGVEVGAQAGIPGSQVGVAGAIVNVCSIESFVALSGHAAYTASKSALLLLTRAFALELAPHGIRVNAVAPGVTETGMNTALRADSAQAGALRARIPMGSFATPAEQAAGVCFLASPEASYITGATLPADGGWLTQ
jgi:NAD(P)-dependent dehydrogenase (short-subunit alcohol dehydrogenase family)